MLSASIPQFTASKKTHASPDVLDGLHLSPACVAWGDILRGIRRRLRVKRRPLFLLVTWLMKIRKQQISVAGTGQLDSQQLAPYY